MRFALMPFALIAAALFAMGAQIMTSTLYHRLAWLETTATVLSSEPFFETSKKGLVTENLKIAIRYRAGDLALSWTGKGSDIGVYKAFAGDRIDLRFDPDDPKNLDTAAMKGWRGGLLLLGTTGGFVIFYVWFFWLRGRRTPPPAMHKPTLRSPLPNPPTPRGLPRRASAEQR